VGKESCNVQISKNTSSKTIRLVCCGIVADQDLTPNVPPVVKNYYILAVVPSVAWDF